MPDWLLHFFGPFAITSLFYLIYVLFIKQKRPFLIAAMFSGFAVIVFEIGQNDGFHWASCRFASCWSHIFILETYLLDTLYDILLGILGGVILPYILRILLFYIFFGKHYTLYTKGKFINL